MKREHTQKYEYLYRMLLPNIIWHECCGCHKDFRFQRGWHAVTGPFYNGDGHRRYLCLDCAPNFETANNFFLNDSWVSPKPIIMKVRPNPLMERIS